jgi:8-oxo-dGTP pyrophosphatase MutT (NUDIX family)
MPDPATQQLLVVPIRSFHGTCDQEALFSPADEAEIDAHWNAALEAKPAMFDGRVLLGTEVFIRDGGLFARYAEVAFSAFNWWREKGARSDLRNVFGAAAVVSADGSVLLGRMAPHTAAAGKIYFPCGTPDLSDIRDGGVDLEYSISRELEEETGLATPDVRASPHAFAIFAPKVVAYVRRYDTDLTEAELKLRVEAHLAADPAPELDRIIFARSVDELTGASPEYVHLALPPLLRSAV